MIMRMMTIVITDEQKNIECRISNFEVPISVYDIALILFFFTS